MKTHAVTQGSTEWHGLRCCIPTASEFDELLTNKWALKDSIARDEYLLRKVAGKVMGYAEESLSSFNMQQGAILESEALPWYEGVYDVAVQRVGFCTTDDGKAGASPDGLIGDDNGLEIKCPTPHVHLSYLLGDGIPRQYLAQVHGCMFVTGRPRWTFISYNRHFPPYIVEVKKDAAIDGQISAAIHKFSQDFDAAMARLEPMIAQKGR